MIWSAIGAALMALGVMLGAFGAHALKERLDAYSMDVYQKAVFYHFIHALGILIVSTLLRAGALTESACTTVCALLAAGIALFSGSLYLLAITGSKGLGAVTPFGGLAFIAAWMLLAYRLLRPTLK
jgi:uncharacterized membrane protein YgdD (TMEM256/DUF423 family)